jgi:hypothetical protein
VVCADESERGLRDRRDGARSTVRGQQGLQQTGTQYSYESSSDDPQASLTNSKEITGKANKPPQPNTYCTIVEPFLAFPAQSTKSTFHWCEYRVCCV